MKQEELLLLLNKGEGPRIEWKQQINIKGERAKEEFIKDLTAMANTSPGDGYIIYGITDTGKVVGIPRKKGLEESLQQISSNRCHPPVEFFCKWIEVTGKNVFIVHIPESQLRPHATSRKDVYVRRQKIIDKVTPIEIHQMMLRGPRKAMPEPPTDLTVEHPAEEDILIQFRRYDLNFFPISGAPQAYRSCQKYGDFDDPSICPVFMPHFGIFAPEPEFGDTKSVIYFEWEIGHIQVEREIFRVFLKSIEARTTSLGGGAGVWNCFPMSWSFSRKQEMDYGLGADNACLALDAHYEGGLLGGIIQFERVSVYKPTNFLTFIAEIYPRERGEILLRQFALRIILSSIPLSRDWVNSIFDVAEILGRKVLFRKPGDDALSEPLYTLRWAPAQPKGTLKPKTLGLFGRDPGSSPEYDIGLGVVIDARSLQKVEFEIDHENSWHSEWYGPVFKVPPSSSFDELPVQITNPIPTREDISAKDFAISIPTMRQVIIGLGGFLVIAINAHSFPR